MRVTFANVVRFFVPIIVGTAMAFICPLQGAGASLPATPPPWVFIVVWTFLYLLMGLTWVFSAKLGRFYDLAFTVLVILLAVWVLLYGCAGKQKAALYVIFLSLLVALSIAFSLAARQSQWALAMLPLVVWLLVASALNFATVNNTFGNVVEFRTQLP